MGRTNRTIAPLRCESLGCDFHRPDVSHRADSDVQRSVFMLFVCCLITHILLSHPIVTALRRDAFILTQTAAVCFHLSKFRCSSNAANAGHVTFSCTRTHTHKNVPSSLPAGLQQLLFILFVFRILAILVGVRSPRPSKVSLCQD